MEGGVGEDGRRSLVLVFVGSEGLRKSEGRAAPPVPQCHVLIVEY